MASEAYLHLHVCGVLHVCNLVMLTPNRASFAYHRASFPLDMSLPSKTVGQYWLWAESLSKKFVGGPRCGKWMLFYDKSVLDDKWAAVKQLVEQDQLGGLAKCSTAQPNPNATSSKSGVIIVYTSDYLDQEEVYRVATTLHEKLEYKATMYYKTDEQTYAGAYRKNGSQKNHIYRYPLD